MSTALDDWTGGGSDIFERGRVEETKESLGEELVVSIIDVARRSSNSDRKSIDFDGVIPRERDDERLEPFRRDEFEPLDGRERSSSIGRRALAECGHKGSGQLERQRSTSEEEEEGTKTKKTRTNSLAEEPLQPFHSDDLDVLVE